MSYGKRPVFISKKNAKHAWSNSVADKVKNEKIFGRVGGETGVGAFSIMAGMGASMSSS